MSVIDVMMSMNVSDMFILSIKGSDYCCIISLIGKNEAITLMKNAEKFGDIEKKNKNLINIKDLFQ